ncbi:MAG TPA: hypothetical protein VI408_07135 [Gaiellaceae bacterium]
MTVGRVRPGAARPHPAPSPHAGELLVRAEALGAGGAVVGVVEEVGGRVAAPTSRPGRERAGLVRVAPERAVAVPPELETHAALAVATDYVAAYGALVFHAQARPGERVLVHGAVRGAGLAAIDLADVLQLRVVATAPPRAHGYLSRRRAVELVLDDGDDWVAAVQDAGCVDVVLDDGLGAGTLVTDLAVLRWGGRLLHMGAAPRAALRDVAFGTYDASVVSLADLLDGKSVGAASAAATPPHVYREWAAALFRWCRCGGIEPVVNVPCG